MTLQSSGSISLGQINTEFSLGHDLSDYYGVRWYKDDNSRGFFTSRGGNNPPISMSEFYAKRASIPVTVINNSSQSNGSVFTFPFYNKITVVITGGSGGSGGSPGVYSGGPSNQSATAGVTGGNGTASSFGSYGSAAGGAGGVTATAGSAGSVTTIIFDANANTTTINGVISQGCPLKGATASITIGSGGSGGTGGPIYGWSTDQNGNFGSYVFVNNAPSGSGGASGSLTVSVQ